MENFYRFSPLVGSILGIVLAVLVMRRGPRGPLRHIFSLFLASMGLWALAIFGMRNTPLEQALSWERAIFAILPVVGVTFFHSVMLLTGAKGYGWLLAAAYAAAIAFIGLSTTTDLLVRQMKPMWYGNGFVGGPLMLPYSLALFGIVIAALYQLARAFRRSQSAPEKNRYAYVAGGAVLCLFGLTTDALAARGGPFYPMGIPSNILFSLITTYAIVKYHLLDIYVVVRKGTAYAIVSAAGVGIIIGVLSFTYIFGVANWRLSAWQNAVLVIAVAALLQPALRRVQDRVDRWFYRSRYDYLRALETLGEQTKAITDLDYIAASLVDTVAVAMGCEKVMVLLPDAEDRNFVPVASRGVTAEGPMRLPRHGVLAWWLVEHQDFVGRQHIEGTPEFQALTSREKDIVLAVDAQLFVPLITREGVRGILALGRRRSEQDYSSEEASMLRVAARQMANTLDNARMYDLKDRRYREQALLTRLSTIVASEIDLETIFTQFVQELRAVLPIDYAGADVNEESNGATASRLTWTALPGLQLPLEALDDPLPPVPAGEVLYEPDLSIDKRMLADAGLSQAGIGSVVRLVLQSKSGRGGYLTVASQKRDAFGDDGLRLLRQVAPQLAIAIDNSRLYDLERSARQELEREFNERTEFVNALIHEVKTPITAMIASSELLREELSTGPPILSELAVNLDGAVHNLNRRISELVEFVKLQSTDIKLHIRAVDVNQLARDAALQVAAMLGNKGQTLDVVAEPGLQEVRADPERLTQVLLNLLTNASKFSKADSSLCLRTYAHDGQAVVELADRAQPLTGKESELIFSPYQRGRSGRGGGLGLGLFICKKLVQLHGGRIWVETGSRGNRFSFSLPLAESR